MTVGSLMLAPDFSVRPWYDGPKGALSYVGINEQDNIKEIESFFNHTSIDKADVNASTAWCAAFVNTVIEDAGFVGSHSAGAHDSAKIGIEVPRTVGAILTWRHKRGALAGHYHTNILHKIIDDKTLACVGGNQNNACNIGNYSTDDHELVACRWPLKKGDPAPAVPADWPQMGDNGPEVLAYQKMLAARGFDPGPLDGICGPRTLAAKAKADASAPTQISHPAPSSAPAPTAQPTAGTNQDKYAWAGKNGATMWGDYVSQDLRISSLPDLVPTGIEDFCPNYKNLSREGRISFWAHLIAKMCEFESNFDPHCIYPEPPPLGVDSVGLLQLSYEDAGGYPLPTLSRANKDLENPVMNLKCAVLIIEKLVRTSGVFNGQVGGSWKGVSAYWSCMRSTKSGAPRPSFAKIRDHVRALNLS